MKIKIALLYLALHYITLSIVDDTAFGMIQKKEGLTPSYQSETVNAHSCNRQALPISYTFVQLGMHK